MTQNYKKIGLTMWLGSFVPNPAIDSINNNLNLLDHFYLILSDDYEKDPNINHLKNNDKVTIITESTLNNYIDNGTKYKFLPDNCKAVDLKANFKSDIVAYNSIDFIRYATNVKLSKVLYLDADYFLYNRWVLRELFETCNSQIVLKDPNLYIKYLPNKDLFNAAVVLDVDGISADSDEIRKTLNEEVCERLKNYPNIRYTAIGPGLTNCAKMRAIWEKNIYSNIEPFGMDIGVFATEGVYEFPLKNMSMGVHITFSTFRQIGFEVSKVEITTNKVVVKIDKKLDN